MNLDEEKFLKIAKTLNITKVKMNFVVLDYMNDTFNLYTQNKRKDIIKDDELFKIGKIENIDCYLDPELFIDDRCIYDMFNEKIIEFNTNPYFNEISKTDFTV